MKTYSCWLVPNQGYDGTGDLNLQTCVLQHIGHKIGIPATRNPMMDGVQAFMLTETDVHTLLHYLADLWAEFDKDRGGYNAKYAGILLNAYKRHLAEGNDIDFTIPGGGIVS